MGSGVGAEASRTGTFYKMRAGAGTAARRESRGWSGASRSVTSGEAGRMAEAGWLRPRQLPPPRGTAGDTNVNSEKQIASLKREAGGICFEDPK